ncbi:DUF6894 family protein [Sphingomonas sp. M1-B02]|uniref:DUF6894 family protein n=1 Tax=Sphingomonas sp. M1-B02 TaxID=3114300 RepID=UPI00223F9C5F|nr:hypothetical protein [Sphingomonas sp. S6-11]UZK67441.1 hypothetical protein OKW87_06305 [Sphingomonas sp. S6-11]
MSLYYFHLRDGTDIVLDPEGRELETKAAIVDTALHEARAILSEDARKGHLMLDQVIDVVDEAGAIVHRLHFIDALDIVWPSKDGPEAAPGDSRSPTLSPRS